MAVQLCGVGFLILVASLVVEKAPGLSWLQQLLLVTLEHTGSIVAGGGFSCSVACGSSWIRYWTHVSCIGRPISLILSHQGKPKKCFLACLFTALMLQWQELYSFTAVFLYFFQKALQDTAKGFCWWWDIWILQEHLTCNGSWCSLARPFEIWMSFHCLGLVQLYQKRWSW